MLKANQKSQLYTKLRSLLTLLQQNVSLLPNGVAAEISLCQQHTAIISDSFERFSNTFFPGQDQLNTVRLELKALLQGNEHLIKKVFMLEHHTRLDSNVLEEAKKFIGEQLPRLVCVLNIAVADQAHLKACADPDSGNETVSTRTPSPPK